MASPTLDKLFSLMAVKKPPKAPSSATPTYNAGSAGQALAAPAYRDHLSPLSDIRLSSDSRDLLKTLFKQDPDVSAAVGSYLTLADTPYYLLHRNLDNQIDPEATKRLNQLVTALTRQVDFSQGFSLKPNLTVLCQELRYMTLLRGAIGTELVFNKLFVPERLQQVDMSSITWYEKAPGAYKPKQRVPGANTDVDLDIPSFFVAFHRRDPTSIYPNSDFVSAINTIAARQTVINELYRIMQVTGFPRIALKVVEEVMTKNAPANVREDTQRLKEWTGQMLSTVANQFATLRSDQAFVHTDSIEPSMINDKNPGMAVDIGKIIEVLNAQNQAALKTMATVIGRGTGAAGVASVEARIAAMNADQLNVPLKQLLDQVFTFLMNVYGIPGFSEIVFLKAELRPQTELEPQLVLRQSRLLQDLSLGLITDDEYHLFMYGRLAPDGAPPLSGTGFYSNSSGTKAEDVTPNDDPLGRSLSGEGSKAHRGNGVK